MYTLYTLPDACSLATHVILNELEQPVEIVDRTAAAEFTKLNPVGTVPTLVEDTRVLREGAAILIYLLDKHENTILPAAGPARVRALEDIMFANATMHPAYGRLFFLAKNLDDGPVREPLQSAAAKHINALWEVVEDQLQGQPFLGGDAPSAADVLLAVYARWGDAFPVDITLGRRVSRMVAAVQQRASFRRALQVQAKHLSVA